MRKIFITLLGAPLILLTACGDATDSKVNQTEQHNEMDGHSIKIQRPLKMTA